jgi:cell division protein FtsW (lipid II flippase)
MRSLDPEANRMLRARWRTSLGVAAGLMTLFALVSTLVSVAYDETLVVPLLMWAGVGCVVMARRSLPHRVTPEERPALGRTAAWIVLALLSFFVLPLVLDRLGAVPG